MTVGQHVRATMTLSGISINLCFWCIPLIVLLSAKICIPPWRKHCNTLCNDIYRAAVRVDDWFLLNVSGARWQSNQIEFGNQSCILIANHFSWSDILLLQSVVAKNGPIIKFLCKWQLALVPIFGLIVLAFDFPVLRRKARKGGDESTRRKNDLDRIRRACRTLSDNPAAILSFAEGTRFTERKNKATQSPYLHLLPPKLGGLETIVESIAHLEPLLIDVSIAYTSSFTFWKFLGGSVPEVQMLCKATSHATLREISVQEWLNKTWQEKDEYIAHYRAVTDG